MPLTKPYSGASRKLVIGIDFESGGLESRQRFRMMIKIRPAISQQNIGKIVEAARCGDI